MFSVSSITFILLLVNYSEENIFSSLIRNNLNRYLKNPLFTKSFVRNSIWQGEPDLEDHDGISPFVVTPQYSQQLNEFIKSQNQFTNDHILEPYGGPYNFEMQRLKSNFAKMIPDPPKTLTIKNNNYVNSKFPIKDKIDDSFLLKSSFNDTMVENKFGNRANSKSMTMLSLSSNSNAYSDSKRINSFNKNQHNSQNSQQKPNQSNLYVKEDSLNFGESIQKVHFYQNNQKKVHNHNNKKINKNSQSSNSKYNQEKALNLKLEYGFKPLPVRKDFLSTNSIQMNEPNNDDSIDQVEYNNDRDNKHSLSRNDNFYNNILHNRSMKSLEHNGRNRLDEFSPDYKKYISYPMETESSDVHKLAFTGVESFRPDHSYMNGVAYEKNLGLMNTISNYPNIKNFKKQGIDCAHHAGYCEYDSSYPIDYVNSIITNCTSIIDDMYIEMPENMNDFSGYKSLFQVGTSSNNQRKNETLCESEKKYIRPSVIKDIHNVYHLILQSSFYFQQVPVEICLKPGSSCNFIGRCNPQVKCTQKYRTHTLISIEHVESDYLLNVYWSKPVSCPKMRMYRLPSACICELSEE